MQGLSRCVFSCFPPHFFPFFHTHQMIQAWQSALTYSHVDAFVNTVLSSWNVLPCFPSFYLTQFCLPGELLPVLLFAEMSPLLWNPQSQCLPECSHSIVQTSQCLNRLLWILFLPLDWDLRRLLEPTSTFHGPLKFWLILKQDFQFCCTKTWQIK